MSQRWNSRRLTPSPNNITNFENSIANKLQNSKLIERSSTMSLFEIQTEFISILNNKTTNVAEKTKIKYINQCENITNLTKMYYFLTNLLLKSDGLGIN
jgi:hypothetical protein